MINKYNTYKSLTFFLQILQKWEFLQTVRNVRNLLGYKDLNNNILFRFSYNITYFFIPADLLSIIIKKTNK